MVFLLPVFLLLSALSAQADPMRTFSCTDPSTGRALVCDRCPPGTYLRARCTAMQKSQCVPCPPGSYTELWNHISKCLRCSVCGQNQVLKTACTAHSDCQCQCQSGYYYHAKYDMCLRHKVCAPGQGVLHEGTSNEDTVCYECPSGTFSDTSSAQQNCTTHRSCSVSGMQLLLKGSSWHDSVCWSCNNSQDGANYLKEIIPAFFVHQHMHIKRLRRVVHRLRSEDGKTKEDVSELDRATLYARIKPWVGSATSQQIRQLPAILQRIGANGATEKLENKLQRIDTQLSAPCATPESTTTVLSLQ
ncbi:tumor necrosis factor receptor superfamily member 6B-like isoform X2 [Thalassophryne amazonica]|uniref:tumor necrosis factor receptor superfamily member 6B-like isoform X2 n=1 Tax=Thalassophryne amazonica TaxID=390379 RepID=UPI0014708BDE|nr:tumor necrosis factor receptor superfamily member 6B-like isoform X2 [Thalassophryne amazonica]